MVNAALYLRRPLLVTGRPGTGKSTLAYSIAWELHLGAVLHWPITSRAQLQDSLYRYDAIGRLQDANLRRLGGSDDQPSRVADFITLGPLGTALVSRARPRVLLIDQFDEGDLDLAYDLIHVLDEGQFTIPELVREAADAPVSVTTAAEPATVSQGVVRCRAFPIVVITSNGERDLPPALTRRCLHVSMPVPDSTKLAEIVQAQLGEQALAEAESMLDDFLDQRDEANLATDDLLNAVYLVTAGLTGGPTRDRVVSALFGQGQPDES
jgi:MoxR-like ATPase